MWPFLLLTMEEEVERFRNPLLGPPRGATPRLHSPPSSFTFSSSLSSSTARQSAAALSLLACRSRTVPGNREATLFLSAWKTASLLVGCRAFFLFHVSASSGLPVLPTFCPWRRRKRRSLPRPARCFLPASGRGEGERTRGGSSLKFSSLSRACRFRARAEPSNKFRA